MKEKENVKINQMNVYNLFLHWGNVNKFISADGEDLVDSNLKNSFNRSKTWKKCHEIDNLFKRCLMV